ncbi:MAG TPA: stimulus-sensing domain-containing protein, partial [Sphingomonas sp.]|uniref:stimulus-sensing domain-containing protein n=1 Tax=Sphingomonas sp. TaxID=28214 RepID=UPI002EDAB788
MAAVVRTGNDELDRDLALAWSGRWTLVTRILAVNIFALALLAGGFFYLDSYRSRLIDQRVEQYRVQAALVGEAIDAARPEDRPALIARLGESTEMRLRIYAPDGRLLDDSWRHEAPTYELRDPATEAWRRHVARFLDRAVDAVAGADIPDDFAEPAVDRAAAWPEVRGVLAHGGMRTQVRRAPDRTLVLSVASPLPARGSGVLFITGNARDITRIVREERLRLGIVLLVVILTSVLLSLFL